MLDIVILAAGMGTRMKSQMPKVLHPVAGRPMIIEVVATARRLEPNRCVIVVGHGAEAVREAVGAEATFVLQAEQLGTGHAVMQAKESLHETGADTVLVLYGDTPVMRAETLRAAVTHHRERGVAVTILSFLPHDPTGYGRIIRDGFGAVTGIVEHKDATDTQRAIQESNSGIMVFDGPWLWANLERLGLSPQGEYYLTDMPGLAVAQGRPVEALVVDEREVMGINHRVQLAEASQLLWARRREHWMLEGVTLVDPATVWMDAEVRIGRDTTIHQNVILRGRTVIGSNCEIGPNVVLQDATIEDGGIVEASHGR
jgi:bifunctional UDP-N-acetylglucosamine pyrophosphorylase / glucosamine-1-phosphate N-acetyltransferase